MPISQKSTFAYLFSALYQRCIVMVSMPIFTRVLSKSQYGQVTVYSSWSGIMTALLTLNLAYGSFSVAMAKFENDRFGYISAVEGVCLFISSGFLVVYFLFHEVWNKVFGLPTWLICIMIFEILCTTAMQLWMGKMRFEFKYKRIIALTFITSTFSAIMALWFVYMFREKGYAKILGQAMITIMIGGVIYVLNMLYGRKIIAKEYWMYAIGFNVPLLLYYMSQNIFNASDKIMISRMVGSESAAIYGVGYSLAMALNIVLSSINNVYVPWFYMKLKTGETNENRVVSFYILLILCVLLFYVILFSPEIITIMAGKEYLEAMYVVPPIACCTLLLFIAQQFINVEFYFEQKRVLVNSSVSAAVVNFVLNLLLIRKLGFVVAAYTTLISYVVLVFANYKSMKILLDKKGLEDCLYDYKKEFVLIVSFLLFSVAVQFFYRLILLRIIIGVLVCALVYCRRELIIRKYREFYAVSREA